MKTQEIRLQSLDEIRRSLTAASSVWDTDNTVDDVFYDSTEEEVTKCGRAQRAVA